MKTRLSQHITLYRYLFAFLTIISLYNLFHSLVVHSFFNLKPEYEIIPTIFFGALYYYYCQRKTIYYDKKTLFFTSKYKKSEIPLTQITAIRRTLTRINNTDSWRIEYFDKKDTNNYLRIVPSKRNPERFENFKSIVKEASPKVIISDKLKTL